jgi:UDP-glucose 4-epimerase
MKVLVTGASGFFGREVVKVAAARGYDVLALVRPTAKVEPLEWPSTVQVVRGDLRQAGSLEAEFESVEAVVHLAAASSGDLASQFSGTVVATENLLRAVPMNSLKRFVHVSSFSVYDFAGIPRFRRALSETTPVEPLPEKRDAYTETKIWQENLVREACVAADTPHVILRPGAIYGPGKDWDFGRAFSLGRLDFIFSPLARFRLTHVSNCAEAAIKAIEASVPLGSTFNIVDDNLPTHGSYYRMCRRAGANVGFGLYIPWLVIYLLGHFVDLVDRVAFGRTAKLPELLALRRQKARWRPIHYSNEPAKRMLGWVPRVTLSDGVEQMLHVNGPRIR